MIDALYVGVGGCLGSIARFLMVGWVKHLWPSLKFPLATLFVNMLGCFLVAFLATLSEGRISITPHMRLMIFVGILGGFTTFSAFGYETFVLWQSSQVHSAILNIVLQIFLGLCSVFLGWYVAKGWVL